MKTIQVTVSNSSANNGWKNVNTLVQAALVAASRAAINSHCGNLKLYNDKSNTPADVRLYFTSDPTVATNAEPSQLPEGYFEFSAFLNGTSLLDKWIKLLDNTNALVSGTCTVVLEIG